MDKDSSQELLARAYSLSNDEETKALYREWAETYDETMLDGLGYLTPRKTAHMLSTLVKDKSIRILDVGSGTGLAGESLADHGFTNIDALDYSSAMLGVAAVREYNGKAVYQNCIEADLNIALDLDDNSYDAMIATGLFTHAHVGPGCLRELCRVLRQNGFFATTVHKDIWESGGFADEVKKLADEGLMRTHGMTMNVYYETDTEPEGWYILWESLK